MKFEIPVYVQSIVWEGERSYRMRGLFEPMLHADGASLERATSRMREQLREATLSMSQELRHDRLAAMAFSPDLIEKRLRIRFDLRRQTVNGKFLFVAFRAFDRFVAFSPSVQELWFEVSKLSDLQDRATEVFQEHFLEQEKRDSVHFHGPEPLEGQAWITTIEFQRTTNNHRTSPQQSFFAMLGAEEELDGEEELFRVGRRLRDLYPDELDHVVRYDPVVEEVSRLLKSPDRRSVAIIGPRRVGKTAMLHEVVRRRMQNPSERSKETGHLWQLSPQRLISGMSFVGQWESRLLAILDKADGKDLTLVFDNVLGLFQAGKTMESSLTVGHVLKGAMQRQRVRVVAEMTLEAFAMLRELDREFADLLHVVRMEEPDERETHLIMIDTMRRLEARHRCRFGLKTVATVFDLQRRFGRDSAFPGKGCLALERLAVKRKVVAASKVGKTSGKRSDVLDREDVLEEFRSETGLPMALVDEAAALDEGAIREQMGQRFVGQPAAMQAAVDIFGLLESRLNDPAKPIATMLLVGPTGVGKTQFAKELARCFFGSADRLVRFDMNQYLTDRAATQLVGDISHPEGLLTSAIRRQPFSVVLLDEIEKAHDDVHNMLLQVLGEGRLTDALGRTCDFTNAILLLTSNLGTSHHLNSVGFTRSDTQEQDRVRRAVQRHFRPEFVNRLDRMIVFNRLSRSDMSGVARTLLNELFERPGLRQRRCLVDMDEDALEWIVDQGYDPAMGARAIRRAIERQLTSRVSEFLAAAPHDESVTLVRARLGDGRLDVESTLIEEQAITPRQVAAFQIGSIDDTLDALRRFVDSRRDMLREIKPSGGIESGKLSPETLRYYDLQESLQTLDDEIGRHALQWEDLQFRMVGKPSTRIPLGPKSHRKGKSVDRMSPGELMGDRNATEDIQSYMRETDTPMTLDESHLQNSIRGCVLEAAWIDVLLQADVDALSETLELQWTGPAKLSSEELLFCGALTARLADACGAEWDHLDDSQDAKGAGWIRASEVPSAQRGITRFRITGAAVQQLVAPELGWHFLGAGVSAVELRGRRFSSVEASGDSSPTQPVPRSVQVSDAEVDGDWKRANVVVRRYENIVRSIPSRETMHAMLAERLELPPEFRELTRIDVGQDRTDGGEQ